jgi:hypothetical protein
MPDDPDFDRMMRTREYFAAHYDEFFSDMDSFVRELHRQHRARPWDVDATARWIAFRDTRRLLVPQPKKRKG